MWKGKAIRSVLSITGTAWDKTHPEVKARGVRVLERANKEFAKDGLQVGIFEAWRDVSRQLEVMSSGNSEVKSPLNSYHPWGLALDFVFLKGPGLWTWEPTGDPLQDRMLWEQLGEIIESEGFEWGGRWHSFDGPHAQLPLQRTAALIAEFSGPDEFIKWA
jgi:hypothetical protein